MNMARWSHVIGLLQSVFGLVQSSTAGVVRFTKNVLLPELLMNDVAGSATSSRRILIKKTGMADAGVVDVLTVIVPNAGQSAGLKLTLVSANGGDDAFESTRVAEGFIAIARKAAGDTVAVVATLDLAQIATTSGGATHTLVYDVSTISGLSSATQTFTVTIAINDSGSAGSNQVLILAELINSEASGVTMAAA